MAEDVETPAKLEAHCPRCNGDRNCDVHGHYVHTWEVGDAEHHENGETTHHVLKCRGCDTVFYHRSAWDTFDYDWEADGSGGGYLTPIIKVVTFPAPETASNRPDWIWELGKTDATLSQIMNEVYMASSNRSYILASVGLRTALDRATEMLKIDPQLPMVKKVDALKDGGWIGETEANTLGVVAEAGNAAAHRGWSPDEGDFKHLLETLEQFILRAILTGKRALEVAPKIPPRGRR